MNPSQVQLLYNLITHPLETFATIANTPTAEIHSFKENTRITSIEMIFSSNRFTFF